MPKEKVTTYYTPILMYVEETWTDRHDQPYACSFHAHRAKNA
jgi:hypothetical protein